MASKRENRSGPSKKKPINASRITRVILSLLLIGVIIYAVIRLSSINGQLNAKKAELKDINDQIELQEIKNSEMEQLNNYSGEELSNYIEQLAREQLDYIKPGERVFVNVSGD